MVKVVRAKDRYRVLAGDHIATRHKICKYFCLRFQVSGCDDGGEHVLKSC